MSLFKNADLPPVPIATQVACVEREIELRKRVYPRWVESGRLKQEKADEEIRRMEAVRDSLVRLAKIDAGTGQ